MILQPKLISTTWMLYKGRWSKCWTVSADNPCVCEVVGGYTEDEASQWNHVLFMFLYCESYLIVMPVCERLCTHTAFAWTCFLYHLIASFLFHLISYVLLLFANVIRLRQGYSSLLAPLAQSELLICFNVHMTFVKAQHPRPAPIEDPFCWTIKIH